ncbi:receptor-like protein 7 [Hevea brasiliensis]|uniref:receptor-like protein 7 n=1 Tax=Hevea brasiliensis TaxID=3981 RepID=UPI0025FC0875|nr:receptor-like protein 7 [Hevea brasiliensis]
MGNESEAQVLGEGQIKLELSFENFLVLDGVFHVHSIRKNLISASLLDQHDFRLVLGSNKVVISKHGNFIGKGYFVLGSNEVVISKHSNFIGKGYLVDGLYKLNVMPSSINAVSFASVINIEYEPKTYNDAMISVDAPFWKEAIKGEMDSLTSNKTWVLYDLSPEETKSTSGYVFTISGGAVSWKSTKQTIISCSTMKVELMALDAASTEAESESNVADLLTKGLACQQILQTLRGMGLKPIKLLLEGSPSECGGGVTTVKIQLLLLLLLNSQCHGDESSALLQFKESLILDSSVSSGPNAHPKVKAWNTNGSDCCLWEGVECDQATGYVINLDLSSSWLHGSINSSCSLFRLVHLHSLNLADNDFNQSMIPPEFGNFSGLNQLNLSLSAFSGQIPQEILKLSKLESLDLSGNVLQLRNPDLGSLVDMLTNLKQLHLGEVDISSTIPHSLANFSSLTSLVLEDCGLYGDFPTGIFQLPNLQLLNINSNPFLTGYLPEFNQSSLLELLFVGNTSFSGNLPYSIDSLKSLHHLDASNCQFSGLVPSSLANLTQLTYLSLAFNNMSSWTFSWLDKLTKLSYLDLDQTNLYGNIPASFQNLSRLSAIRIRTNQLTGRFPSWLGNLTQLTVLALSENNMYGPVPESVSWLTNLQIFELVSNSFSGTLKFDMFLNMKSLWDLQLTDNSLSVIFNPNTNATVPQLNILGLGSCNLTEFPDFLRGQDQLGFLVLSGNNIHGKIPKWMLNVSKETLWSLELSSNFLTGFEEPPALLPWASLMVLYLSSNNLQGPLPIPPPSMVYYNFSNNQLTGEISEMICNLTSLSVLDLSNNNLSGLLPQCLGYLGNSLLILNLRNNSLGGAIPPTYTKECQLTLVDFSQNQMEGQIPRSLANCTRLETLDLGDNMIHDTFPSWLGTLPELRVLILRSNRFYGAIGKPEQTQIDFPKLHIIDLSFNSFTGKLPSQQFENWVAMKDLGSDQLAYLQSNTGFKVHSFTWRGSLNLTWSDSYDHSVTVSNKGILTEYTKILEFFTAVDLSSNKFEGDIPPVIGTLKALLLLNLSNNDLTGKIPPELGEMTSIESLDLSGNKLSGEIPKQLTQLTFLAFLNVSYNRLAGPIPQGNQFSTFENNSFEGNSGLCGQPLSKECGGNQPPYLTSQEDEGSDTAFRFTWGIIAAGFAFGFMMGGLMGHIAFERKKEWLMKTFRVRQKKRRLEIRGHNNRI